MDEPIKRKRGRPPKSSSGVKNYSIYFRATADLRSRLDADAQTRGVSLSEEITRQLEERYDRKAFLADLLAIVRHTT